MTFIKTPVALAIFTSLVAQTTFAAETSNDIANQQQKLSPLMVTFVQHHYKKLQALYLLSQAMKLMHEMHKT